MFRKHRSLFVKIFWNLNRSILLSGVIKKRWLNKPYCLVKARIYDRICLLLKLKHVIVAYRLMFVSRTTTAVESSPPSFNSFNAAIQSKYFLWRSFKRRTKGNLIRTRTCKKDFDFAYAVSRRVSTQVWIKTMHRKLVTLTLIESCSFA